MSKEEKKMRSFLNNKQHSSSVFTKAWYYFSSSESSEFVGYSIYNITREPFLTEDSTFDFHLVGKECQGQRKLELKTDRNMSRCGWIYVLKLLSFFWLVYSYKTS